jgi:hypothetical protein
MRLWRKTTTQEFVQGFFWIDVAEKYVDVRGESFYVLIYEYSTSL